jgi:predicted HTH transcriptional regulator
MAMEKNGSPEPLFETDDDYSSFITMLPVHPAFLSADGDGVNENIKIVESQAEKIQSLIRDGVNDGVNNEVGDNEGVNNEIIDGVNNEVGDSDGVDDGVKHEVGDNEGVNNKINDGVNDGVGDNDGVNESIKVAKSQSKKIQNLIRYGVDDGSDGVIDGVNDIVQILLNVSGLNASEIALRIKKSIPTVERYLRLLRKKGIIEFKGVPKTGGYHLTEKAKVKLK